MEMEKVWSLLIFLLWYDNDCINKYDHLKLSVSAVIEKIVGIIILAQQIFNNIKLTRNDPKFSDRYAWANSADPDQTALGAVWSGSTMFAIPFASFGRSYHYSMV